MNVEYRETPPCRNCGHWEHPEDVCETDLGEFGECQCADSPDSNREGDPAFNGAFG